MWAAIGGAVAVALGLFELSTLSDDEPPTVAPPTTLGIADATAAVATDLGTYWAIVVPDGSGTDGSDPPQVEPAVDAPPCPGTPSSTTAAAYCAATDVVTIETERYLADLHARHGDVGVAAVLAHQWGHAALTRSAAEAADVESGELAADCWAGSFLAWWSEDRTDSAVAVSALTTLEGPPDAAADAAPVLRVQAFEEGFERGADACLQPEL